LTGYIYALGSAAAVSGLGATQAEAQSEVLVGMGLVAGSSVMLLTALWGSCLIVGRCDLVDTSHGKLVAKDRTLNKGFSLFGNFKPTLHASHPY
jgi:hypothetical protein